MSACVIILTSCSKRLSKPSEGVLFRVVYNYEHSIIDSGMRPWRERATELSLLYCTVLTKLAACCIVSCHIHWSKAVTINLFPGVGYFIQSFRPFSFFSFFFHSFLFPSHFPPRSDPSTPAKRFRKTLLAPTQGKRTTFEATRLNWGLWRNFRGLVMHYAICLLMLLVLSLTVTRNVSTDCNFAIQSTTIAFVALLVLVFHFVWLSFSWWSKAIYTHIHVDSWSVFNSAASPIPMWRYYILKMAGNLAVNIAWSGSRNGF